MSALTIAGLVAYALIAVIVFGSGVGVREKEGAPMSAGWLALNCMQAVLWPVLVPLIIGINIGKKP